MAGKLIRKPFRAGAFYPGNKAEVEQAIEEIAKAAPRGKLGNAKAVAAIAPHAGWVFSGPTAYAAIKALLDHSEAKTVVVFGAVHNWNVRMPTVTEADEWITPLGPVEVDGELRDTLMGAELPLEADEHAHNGEHSIEVEIPFIQALSGAVKILPIAMPPVPESIEVSRAIAKVAGDEGEIIVVASTDLTHYGAEYYGWAPKGAGFEALKWVKEKNDHTIVQAMLEMRDSEIIGIAEEDRSACGAGAASAAAAFAKGVGAKGGTLIHYTTSYDARPDGEPSDFVGYAGIVYTL